MTQHELTRLLHFNGLWLVGDRRFHNACQPVVVLENAGENAGVGHVMHVGHRVSSDLSLWPESTFIMGGPFTRQSIEELDQMAADVEERFLMVQHDRDFWRDMVRRMEPFVVNAANDAEMEWPDRNYAMSVLADLREAEELGRMKEEKA